jgi:hypothetical protein
MMARFKIFTMSLLSSLALGAALWPVAAMADPTILETNTCEVKNEEVAVLCVVPTEQSTLWEQNQTGEWSFESAIEKSTTVLLAGTSAESTVPDVSCSGTTGTFALDTSSLVTSALNILKSVALLTSCSVTNTSETKTNCEVKEPVGVRGGGKIEAGNNVTLEQEGELTIKNVTGKTCALTQVSKLKGSQQCYFKSDEELVEDPKEHLLVCPGEGSLLLASQPANLAFEDSTFLGKGNKWSLKGGPVELANGNRNYGRVQKRTTLNRVFTFRNSVALEYTGLNVKRQLGTVNGFKEVTNSCKGAKAANATCTVEVQFAPQEAEDYVSVLELFWEAGGLHVTRNLVLLGQGTP